MTEQEIKLTFTQKITLKWQIAKLRKTLKKARKNKEKNRPKLIASAELLLTQID